MAVVESKRMLHEERKARRPPCFASDRSRRYAQLQWRATVAMLGTIAVALVLVLSPYRSSAQAYPQMHVSALSQRSDRSSVAPNGTFHVTIHVRITQRRDRLDELILGSFTNCEIISNETVRNAVPGGTDFVERLTVQALAPGQADISPAYIDALDPALGRPMRFSSNAIAVRVTTGDPVAGLLDVIADKARRLLLAAVIVAGIFAAGFLVFALFARRRRRQLVRVEPSAPITVVAPPVPMVSRDDRFARALETYRIDRDQAALLQLRAVLFGLAGTVAGATLVDALRTLGDRDADLRAALIAAEAAGFGPASERTEAGETLLRAGEAYRRRSTAAEGSRTR